GLEALPGRGQSELIEAAERREVRGGEGSVGHVEVFRMGCVRTSIIGRPRPISASPLRAPRHTPLFAKSPFVWPDGTAVVQRLSATFTSGRTGPSVPPQSGQTRRTC